MTAPTGLRIGHVMPSGVHPHSGIVGAVTGLCAALAGAGQDVTLWLLDEGPGGPVSKLANRGVTVRRTRVGEPPEADIVHLHGVFNVDNPRLARRLRVPYLLSPHGGYAPESLAYHRHRKRLFAALAERPMVRRAAAVHALTDHEAEEVTSFVPGTSVSVIPNGITPLAREPAPRFAPAAIYVGRLDVRVKRLDAVVRAAAEAPAWTVDLVGPDFRSGRRRLERLIGEAGLTGRVRCVGPDTGSSLAARIAGAALFLLPSRSEGWPMALLEALAAGVPALVSPEIESRLGIAAAGAGWVAEPDGFGRVLSELDPAGWAPAAAAARTLARRFEWSRIVPRYVAMYRSSTR